MTSEDKLIIDKVNRPKWPFVLLGAAVCVAALGIFVWLFATPSAEEVFKDMKGKMLQVKSLTVDQSMTMTGDSTSGRISTKMYLDMTSSSELNASGDFDMSIKSDGIPLAISGDIIKVGDDVFVRYSDISSDSVDYADIFSAYDTGLSNNWIKTKSTDQLSSFATGPIDFATNIIPIPYANLTNEQRDNVLKNLNDSEMYTIEESTKVDVGGVAAYKYNLKYDRDLYEKIAAQIHDYQSYLKTSEDDEDSSEISDLTAWVDINTKRLIKVEYTGTSDEGKVVGKMEFSGYGDIKSVDEPSDYSIESALID